MKNYKNNNKINNNHNVFINNNNNNKNDNINHNINQNIQNNHNNNDILSSFENQFIKRNLNIMKENKQNIAYINNIISVNNRNNNIMI